MLKKSRRKMVIWHVSIMLLLMATAGIVHADVGHGGADVSTVTSVIHAAGDLESMLEKFNAAMDQYAAEKSRCEKIVDPNERVKCVALSKKLLEEAADLLAKLNEQADRIESTIALNKKRVGKDLSEKLDRVLERVVKVRQEANARMKMTVTTG